MVPGEYYVKFTEPENVLCYDGSIFSCYEMLDNGDIRCIECNIVSKEMQMKMKKRRTAFFQNYDMIGYQSESIIEMKESGKRWEGPSLLGIPFGFGRLFEDDFKMYEGFLFDTMKVGYGTTFFRNSGSIEYEGTFYCDMRHGYGRLFDPKGFQVYEGYWLENSSTYAELVCCEPGCEDSTLLHSLMFEMRIGSQSFSTITSLELRNYPVLEMVQIGKESFKNVTHFLVTSCPNLQEIELQNEAFYSWDLKYGDFQITNCPQLRKMVFGTHSFCYYSFCEFSSKAL